MSRRLQRVATVTAARTVVVLGVDAVAFAKTGSGPVLGRSNSANRTTTVSATGPGAARRPQTKASSPPPCATNALGRGALPRAMHAPPPNWKVTLR
jgi:hypothetical protein